MHELAWSLGSPLIFDKRLGWILWCVLLCTETRWCCIVNIIILSNSSMVRVDGIVISLRCIAKVIGSRSTLMSDPLWHEWWLGLTLCSRPQTDKKLLLYYCNMIICINNLRYTTRQLTVYNNNNVQYYESCHDCIHLEIEACDIWHQGSFGLQLVGPFAVRAPKALGCQGAMAWDGHFLEMVWAPMCSERGIINLRLMAYRCI